VSGAWERLLNWREIRAVEAADAAAAADEDAFAAALEAATLEAFGAPAHLTRASTADTSTSAQPATSLSGPGVADAAPVAVSTGQARRGPRRLGPLPVAFQALFLVAVFLGGVAAAVTSGTFAWRTDMGPAFADIVVDGPLMWPLLFVGGILVGFGTRYAGGCSSGHGLSGCGRLQLSSIVATAVFFGTGVAVSTLLWKVV
jgi:hypothetical protein